MALSPDEVRSAWRALTDEAVPDDALVAQMCALPSLAALRRMVMETHGFQLCLPRSAARVPLTAPALSVETRADPATMAALLSLVRRKWHQLGNERPHWSVTANDDHLPPRITQNQAAFEATGQQDFAMILATLARNELAPNQFTHVCDFGCGVGRIPLPLAGRFPHITACDVSEPHLLLASEAASRAG